MWVTFCLSLYTQDVCPPHDYGGNGGHGKVTESKNHPLRMLTNDFTKKIIFWNINLRIKMWRKILIFFSFFTGSEPLLLPNEKVAKQTLGCPIWLYFWVHSALKFYYIMMKYTVSLDLDRTHWLDFDKVYVEVIEFYPSKTIISFKNPDKVFIFVYFQLYPIKFLFFKIYQNKTFSNQFFIFVNYYYSILF